MKKTGRPQFHTSPPINGDGSFIPTSACVQKKRVPRSIRVALIRDTKVPKRQTAGAAGYDLHFCADADVRLGAGQRALFNTGVIVEIPEGHCGQIWPRSSYSVKGLDIGAGLIDSDYRGEIKVLLINNGMGAAIITPGDRIAQLVIVPCVMVGPMEITQMRGLQVTDRGTGGFGSTN